MAINVDELLWQASRTFALPGLAPRLITSGRTYDIYVLNFETSNGSKLPDSDIAKRNERTCIARVAQHIQSLQRLKAEIQTMRYVHSKTSLSVPCVCFDDVNPSNLVGTQYMVIERIIRKPFIRGMGRVTPE